jgi:hypothetical protein
VTGRRMASEMGFIQQFQFVTSDERDGNTIVS